MSLASPHLTSKPKAQSRSKGETSSMAAINGAFLTKVILTFLFHFWYATQPYPCCTSEPSHPSVWGDGPIWVLSSSMLSATLFYFPYCNYFWIINTQPALKLWEQNAKEKEEKNHPANNFTKKPPKLGAVSIFLEIYWLINWVCTPSPFFQREAEA